MRDTLLAPCYSHDLLEFPTRRCRNRRTRPQFDSILDLDRSLAEELPSNIADGGTIHEGT